MINLLKEHLSANKNNLVGEWVNYNSSYDGYICKILDMKEDTVRYWDAIWNEQYIEFKKGNSIWLDLVRYSEILLNKDELLTKTITLFFIPNKMKDRIEEIICVKTNDLIGLINLNEESAKQLIVLNKQVPRSLNAQASVTKKDLRGIATFIV